VRRAFARRIAPALIAAVSTACAADATGSASCTYTTWNWNTRTRSSQDHRRVRKAYADLTPEEKDPYSACTVCEEDQITLTLAPLPPFQICKYYARDVEKAFRQMKDAGFVLTKVSAYRVGKSKGSVDRDGVRTQFSHHSFGTAVDINSEKNGLYTDCGEFGPQCRLLRGGVWHPGVPGTVTKGSVAYRAFQSIGWKWGGEMTSRQKDFMHFSLTGD
jgi:hypothetical protein